jgi:predicted RNA binding protein YcfA (HicA-like mRNA interferase family)
VSNLILPGLSDDADGGDVTAIPKTINQKSGRKLLERHGWTKTGGGKHSIKMEKEGKRPITLPRHRGQEYSVDLTRSILKQAGII